MSWAWVYVKVIHWLQAFFLYWQARHAVPLPQQSFVLQSSRSCLSHRQTEADIQTQITQHIDICSNNPHLCTECTRKVSAIEAKSKIPKTTLINYVIASIIVRFHRNNCRPARKILTANVAWYSSAADNQITLTGGDAVVKALACDLRGHKFDSRMFHCQV